MNETSPLSVVFNQGNLTEWRRLSTVDLLVSVYRPNAFDIANIIYYIYKTSYLNEEVKCTEPSPSVSVPWLTYHFKKTFEMTIGG